MYKNKILKLSLISTLLFAGISCSDEYLDVNENPNNIHAENITPELMLPGAISTAYRTQAIDMMRFGNLMMNSWTGNTYAFGGPFAREMNLSTVDNTFYSNIWSGLYPRISNFAQIERYPNDDHKQDYYIAIAKIMKAYYMQYIVDLYGDAPYSQAFLGQANMSPAYDNDEDIYRNLITNLNEANQLITNADPDIAINPEDSGVDIVFGGEMLNWIAFSNSIKLKMLIRMSKVTGSMASFRDTQLASLVGQQFIEQDVLENPGYSPANDDSMSPFLLTWRVRSDGSNVQNYSMVTASQHIATVLNGNPYNFTQSYYQKFNGISDPRKGRLFTLVNYNGLNGIVKGIEQGAVPGDPGAPTDNTVTSRLGIGNFSGVLPLNLTNGNRGGVLMSLAELKFLMAEASIRYPGMFSGGEAAFNEGIQASGDWLGVVSMTSYISGITSRVGLGWTGTNEQKIEAIMTQKWLALTNVNPTEMFIEYCRTGYPETPMATNAQAPRKPYRLIYPFSEYAANSANVPNVTSADVFTKNQKTPFWNQN